MPSLETWQQATNFSEDFNFTSAFVENREHQGNGQQQMMLVTMIISILFLMIVCF